MQIETLQRIVQRDVGIAIATLLLTTIYVILETGYNGAPTAPVLGFSAICVLTGTASVSAIRRQPISIAVVVFTTAFIFFGLAPLVQFLTDSWVLAISPVHIIEAQVIIFIWLSSMIPAYAFAQRRSAPWKNCFQITVTPRVVRTCWIGAIVTSAFLLALFGLDAFLTRGSLTAARATTPLPTEIAYVIQKVVRPMALLFALVPIAHYRWSGRDVWRPRRDLTFAVLLIAIYVNNPAGSARLYAFAVMLGGFIIWFAPMHRTALPVFLATFVGLLASQAADIFRKSLSLSGAFNEYNNPSLVDYLASTHFDSFENVMLAVEYVNREGHTNGWQLFGGVVFWFPRAFWPEKPIGTGFLLYRYYQEAGFKIGFFNHAVAPAGTAFMDFGLPAVLGLGLFHGVIIAALDGRLAVGLRRIQHPEKGLENELTVDYGFVVLAIFAGLWLVHIRGGWLSTVAIMSYFLIGALVVWYTISLARLGPNIHR